MEKSNLTSLIQTLTSSQINDLLTEYDLEKNGYKFYYFIDTHDLSRMSFPFGLIKNESFDDREKRPIEIITDELLAYDFLLRTLNQKCLLFDEYLVEYRDFKRKINSAKLLGLDLVDSLKVLVEYYDKFFSEKKISHEEFQNLERISEFQLSLLLSIVTGTISQGIEKLNLIESNNLIHSINDFNKIEGFEKKLINEIVNSEPTAFTEKIFEHLTKTFSKQIIYSPDRLKAKYNDCLVYDRLVQLNNKTLKTNIGFFLLSSPPDYVSNKLSKVADKNQFNPLLNDGNPFNPFRSINQIYLKLLLAKSSDYHKDLNLVYDLTLKKESDYKIKQFADENLIKHFENRINELREGFENASLLQTFSDYNKEISNAFQNKEVKKSQFLIPILESILEIAKNNDSIEHTKNIKLKELIFERTYKNTLSLGLENINRGICEFEICKGNDYITNLYHHLPLVYFFTEENGNQDACNEIVKFLTEIDPKKRNSRALIKSINSSLNFLFIKAEPTYAETLIRLLILLLLRTETDEGPEALGYETAEKLLNSELKEDPYRIEYLYFLSWIARRKADYPKALEFADEGIKINRNDPRFYQSKTLIYYCLYLKTSNNKYLNDAIDNAKKSIELYTNLKAKNIAIKKSLIALLNAITYLYCLYYEKINRKLEYLNEARTNLDILKSYELNFLKIPEFLHTEAYLIKLEIDHEIDHGLDKEEAKKKIRYAIYLIGESIKINSKEDYKKLEVKLNELLTEIINK